LYNLAEAAEPGRDSGRLHRRQKRAQINRLASRNSSVFTTFSLAGEVSLGGLSALLKIAPLLISNNTGPVHVAAAVGTSVVDIYALTNPQHTPWGVPNRVLSHDVPCRNCFKSICPEGHNNCLRLIKPQAIAAAAIELLNEKPELLPADLLAAE
jgi:ADP-heptose:LPS heptosyltransferase